MRTKNLAVSFLAVLMLSLGSLTGIALGYTSGPVRALGGPGGSSGSNPSSGSGSGSGSTTQTNSNTGSQQLNPNPIKGGDSGDNNTGGGPSATVNKLSGKPLNICKGRQANINNILNRVSMRGTNQLNFFDSIATKVEAFVTSKGLTVPDYSTMVSNLTTDQSNVKQDLANLIANDTFSCSSSDPTGTASTFKTDMKQEITDLQTYQKDLKTLIQAVKTVAQANQSSSSSSNSSSTGGNQ